MNVAKRYYLLHCLTFNGFVSGVSYRFFYGISLTLCRTAVNAAKEARRAGAPRAERRPGARSNMTDFRCCELLFFQSSRFFRSKSERPFRSKLGDFQKKNSNGFFARN